jgi:hypothetical protein
MSVNNHWRLGTLIATHVYIKRILHFKVPFDGPKMRAHQDG